MESLLTGHPARVLVGTDDIDTSPAPTTPAPARRRPLYALCVLGVIVLGLGSRKFAPFLPLALRKYPGDVLWAVMVYLACGFLFPRLSGWRTGVLAAMIAFAVECFKLYHTPALDAVRPTAWYRLLFGTSFSIANLVCYAGGIGLGLLLDCRLRTHATIKPTLPA